MNLQDMRENADALRLAKEVMLQRYLESLLRLPGGLSRSPCGRLGQLGQLVGRDVFEAAAAYRLLNGQTGPGSGSGGSGGGGGTQPRGHHAGHGRLKLALVGSSIMDGQI